MKTTSVLCVLIGVLLLPPLAIAGTTSGEHSLDVGMELTLRLVGLPKAPSFTAKGKGKLVYTLNGQSAVIKGESIPKLTYEAKEELPGLKGLTVTIEGVSGTTSTVDWEKYPQISLRPVDLRVRAYEAKGNAKPVVDVILSDLSFSTEAIKVAGIEDQGYIDAEELEAQVVAQTTLPEHPYPQYAETIAGKPAILELVIRMKNFFEK